MSEYQEFLKEKERKKAAIKELLQRLHGGEDPKALKNEFRDAIDGLMPDEIATIEGELIEGGVPAEEVHRLCDVHIEVFRENLEQTGDIAPPGHPIHILMDEHRLQMEYTGRLKALANRLKAAGGVDAPGDELEELHDLADRIAETESHYVREENVLFPYLERHGITQPPQIMWTDHDTVRGLRKGLTGLLESRGRTDHSDFVQRLDELSVAVAESLQSNIFKENNVLFPTSLKVMETSEWKDIRHQFDDLGYCSYTPEPPGIEFDAHAGKPEAQAQRIAPVAGGTKEGIGKGIVEFAAGTLTFEEVEAIFDSLPVDITFVGKDDTVRYFSQSPERIFPRAKAIIGRTVQNCHPQKSLHRVNAILDGFRAGNKESADFWIDMGEMKVHIRYFPVHNKKGEYLGCLEVTQDIAPIKRIEGEKRLL